MLSLLILAALIKVNLECDTPWIATGLFAGSSFILSLMFGHPFLAIVIGTAINVGLGFLYFWSLKKTEESSTWWAIMILGLFAYLGLAFI